MSSMTTHYSIHQMSCQINRRCKDQVRNIDNNIDIYFKSLVKYIFIFHNNSLAELGYSSCQFIEVI